MTYEKYIGNTDVDYMRRSGLHSDLIKIIATRGPVIARSSASGNHPDWKEISIPDMLVDVCRNKTVLVGLCSDGAWMITEL